MPVCLKLINDNEILLHFGGLNTSSLIRVLNQDDDNEGAADDGLETIQHSSYYSTSTLINELADKKDSFNILSLNCGSINAKIDQLMITLNEYKHSGCNFHAICLQETWLNDQSDTCLLQIEGYKLISQTRSCSARGGLIIYLNNNIKYKLLDGYTDSDIWEGQFIEILFENSCVKNLILGNIYRPPHDNNANYQQFINELTPLLITLGNRNSDVIIAGDYNIDLLKSTINPCSVITLMPSHLSASSLK